MADQPIRHAESIRIGTMLAGFCGGWFGRDSYGDKRVEALGVDWVVVRNQVTGKPEFADCAPERLAEHVDCPHSLVSAEGTCRMCGREGIDLSQKSEHIDGSQRAD